MAQSRSNPATGKLMVSLNIKQIEVSTVVVYAAGYLTIVFLSVCLGMHGAHALPICVPFPPPSSACIHTTFPDCCSASVDVFGVKS